MLAILSSKAHTHTDRRTQRQIKFGAGTVYQTNLLFYSISDVCNTFIHGSDHCAMKLTSLVWNMATVVIDVSEKKQGKCFNKLAPLGD